MPSNITKYCRLFTCRLKGRSRRIKFQKDACMGVPQCWSLQSHLDNSLCMPLVLRSANNIPILSVRRIIKWLKLQLFTGKQSHAHHDFPWLVEICTGNQSHAHHDFPWLNGVLASHDEVMISNGKIMINMINMTQFSHTNVHRLWKSW